MNIHASAEDYLERILMLKEKTGHVRSVDIARALGYSKPSVSIAMKQLRENGYITMGKDGGIDLTESGQIIAAGVYEKHQVLVKMLINMGVSEDVAREDACRLEHAISEESFQKLCAHLHEEEALR